jgi:uncharacterized protein
MSRPVPKTLNASRSVHGLLLSLGALSCLLPLTAWANRPVPVYQVDVAERGGQALQDAMRQVLVRATGHRDTADDPALAAFIADAPKYVQDYDTGAHGQSQAVFDANAVQKALAAAGHTLWDPNRPFTLVVLDPPRVRAAADSSRAQLEKVAAERGLPISVVPLTLVDADGKPLGREAVLDAAQRFGADEVLVGRGDDGNLQWTLYTHTTSETWNGPLAAGIDHTVDGLVPQGTGALAQAESRTRVKLANVVSLSDYANVGRLLQATPGVRHVGIVAADAASATFEVSVRGGAAGLEQGLAGQSRFTKLGSGDYRYQPQGTP